LNTCDIDVDGDDGDDDVEHDDDYGNIGVDNDVTIDDQEG
jgi:hypothetical protein